MLERADGPVLDVGCGPGRHVVALAERGVTVLGIDVSPSVLGAARARGAPVLERSVFDRVPGAGRWGTALLLDGNLGIGGDPVFLLGRIARLLRPGAPSWSSSRRRATRAGPRTVFLDLDGRPGPWFRWAHVAVDELAALARTAALTIGDIGPATIAGSRSWSPAAMSGPTIRPRFQSGVRSERTAAWLGAALGVSFTVCFVTGLYSHLLQHPPSWFTAPARPAGLYRITQGVHVATGIASIPLLFAKLWTVFPKLFQWPPFLSVGPHARTARAAPARRRIAVPPLHRPREHQPLVSLDLQLPHGPLLGRLGHDRRAASSTSARSGRRHVTALARRDREDAARYHRRRPARRSTAGDSSLTVFGAGGVLTLFTVGQTVAPLQRLALLAPRRPDTGPQGFPVNRTAAEAQVLAAARDPAYRLVVEGRVRRRLSLSLDDLGALPVHEASLPIACVDGWSANRTWQGVRVRDLLHMAGAADDAEVTVESLQRRRSYRTSSLDVPAAHDPDTLLALRVDGEVLHIDHGYPLRLIAPNRPGVMQTKWVTRLVVR